MTSFESSTAGTVNPATGQVVWNRPADRLREQYQAEIDGIRNRTALSLDAVRALMASTYVDYLGRMADLQRQAGVASAADIAAIKRRLFGIDAYLGNVTGADRASAELSFRDAQDRARKIGGEAEAVRALEEAEVIGDELLAQAVFNAAAAGGIFGNEDVITRFLQARPAKAAAWNELQAQSTPRGGAALFEFVLDAPSELGGLTETQIRTLAASAGDYQL